MEVRPAPTSKALCRRVWLSTLCLFSTPCAGLCSPFAIFLWYHMIPGVSYVSPHLESTLTFRFRCVFSVTNVEQFSPSVGHHERRRPRRRHLARVHRISQPGGHYRRELRLKRQSSELPRSLRDAFKAETNNTGTDNFLVQVCPARVFYYTLQLFFFLRKNKYMFCL